MCEQSDTNLRQYLGKPLNQKSCKQEEEDNSHSDLYTSFVLDSFGLDDSSNDSDDSFKHDFILLTQGTSANDTDEKTIAQKQLLKTTKLQKGKLTKKKLLAKVAGKASMYFELNPPNTNVNKIVLK